MGVGCSRSGLFRGRHLARHCPQEWCLLKGDGCVLPGYCYLMMKSETLSRRDGQIVGLRIERALNP